VVLLVTLAAKDADAAEHVAHRLDTYLESLLGRGLLAFRIGRDTADPSRIALIEEWTNDDAHAQSAGLPAFAEMQRALAPLLAAPPSAATYEVVAAGFADDDD